VDPSAECDLIAASQHGAFSRRQALTTGMTERVIDRRVASGEWLTVYPGVYVPRAVPRSWRQLLMATVLRGGPTALASHRSAAALWNLDGVQGQPIEISVKAGRRIPGTIVHRRIDDPETVQLDGIPATAVERTLVDLAIVATQAQVGLALDSALRAGSTSIKAIEASMQLTPGRAGTRLLNQLLSMRDGRDAVLESQLESTFLNLLRRHDLPGPVAQHEVRDGARLLARLDFAYPACRLGIETDGYRWHSGRERWRNDIRRDNQLKLLGWTILRFTWEDVHRRPAVVVAQIRDGLERALSQLPTSRVGD
jgi:very-short-patch-repair endonuclease